MMKLIKTTVLDTTAASVTISNIPQEFKSIMLLISLRSDGGGGNAILLRPNGSTLYGSYRYIEGSGSSASSGGSTANLSIGNTIGTGQTSNTFTNVSATLSNYSANANKVVFSSAVIENNATTSWQDLMAGLWASTDAITSLQILSSSGNLVAGSTFYLYGVA